MRWFKRKPKDERVDPDAGIRLAEATQRRVTMNQPFVNHLSNYAIYRKGKNGFGEDVEFTFRPKQGGAST